MEDKFKLLLHFDRSLILSDMRSECEKFLAEFTEKTSRQFPPFRYVLQIDTMHLLNADACIGQLLLDEPMKWREMSADILYACIKSLTADSSDITLQRSQVDVILRLNSLSQLLIRPNVCEYRGLVCFQGILINISKRSNYVVHSIWSCPEDCEGNEVIIQYIPKTPPRCHVCKSILYENGGLRRCGERVQATFMVKNHLLCKRFTIVDDLIAKLTLGFAYNLIGVVVKTTTFIWSIESANNLVAPSTMPLPKDISKLYDTCAGTPWMFIYCLASSIGVNLCPLNCFMHLKICLLISLASVKSNINTGCAIFNVLTAGPDTGYVGQLMKAAAELADQAVFLGNTNTVVTTALIASSGGVCLLPLPLHAYCQKQLCTLWSAVESKEFSTDNGMVKLRSAIWAHGMDFKKINLHNVASIFGLVCRGDCDEYNDEIIDFMLQEATVCASVGTEEKDVYDDIKMYLDAIAGIHVKLGGAAEVLLRNYFLAARKDLPRSVSASTMGGLAAICLTSARLCRRNVANVDDAVFAVWLHVSGTPAPRIAPDEYLQTPANVKTLNKNMDKFKEWLETFTGNILNID